MVPITDHSAIRPGCAYNARLLFHRARKVRAIVQKLSNTVDG